ncbi:MAG TPA: hypothetical protein VLE51_01215 [Candidatus Saccharimonadales bacterium]|nr:hypothetical protein [Candidatus Saccharimonadales bacterium]
MLQIAACLAGIFFLLVISEILGRQKNLRGDPQRKFVHITAGVFIAFWPWLISWRSIEWIGVAMLAIVLLNHRVKLVDFHSKIKRDTYGDIFFALAVILIPLITNQKIFFALTILIMSLADGLASLVGQRYGQKWRYKVFHHNKTVIGSMTLWFVSLCVLAVGVLFAHDLISFRAYVALLLALPPILVIVENITLMGLDNLAMPLVVLLALNLAR